MELREILLQIILYTWGSLGKLVKVVETLVSQVVFPQHFLFSLTSTRISVFQ